MKNVRASIIAAIDEKRGLGKNNDLLFKIPADFERLKALTIGHPIIMGRKTYESIGRPLPKRTNIIITRDSSYKVEGAIVVGSLEEGIRIAKEIEVKRHSGEEQRDDSRISHVAAASDSGQARMTKGEHEVFIFGGGQIFKQALEKNLVDRLYLTVVKGDYGADTFFPDYSAFKKVLKQEDHEEEGYSFTFLDLER